VLAKYGTREQQEKWLKPLMEVGPVGRTKSKGDKVVGTEETLPLLLLLSSQGTIRSTFLMTEPDVASSDASNIETSIVRDGDDYVINGRKWWSTGVSKVIL